MKPLSLHSFFRGLGGILRGSVNHPQSLKDNVVLKTLLNRRSVRKFQQREIPDDVLHAILEAGRVAPSTVNLQTWKFGVFDRGSWKELFDREIPFKGDKAVIIMGDMHRIHQTMNEFPFKPLIEYTLGVTNASIAAYAMNIAAEACGVCSVMLSETGKTGFYDALYLKEKLDLPEGVFPIMTMVFGYPKSTTPIMPPKLPMNAVTFFHGKYREADKEDLQNWLEEMMAGYRATFVTRGFKGKLNHYLKKADEAESTLHELIFYRKEEFIDKID